MSKYDTSGQKSPALADELADKQLCDHCREVVRLRESPHGRAWCPECRCIQRGEGEPNGGVEMFALEYSVLGAGGHR
jgi:hypothetical protein